ncbi:MAG: hypothetical protein ACOVJ4_06625 [Sphingobacteriaceae bacterium]
MKRFALLGMILGWSILLHAQENTPKKTLSNEDIWAKNYFAAKSINGLQSMKDGKDTVAFIPIQIRKKITYWLIVMLQEK